MLSASNGSQTGPVSLHPLELVVDPQHALRLAGDPFHLAILDLALHVSHEGDDAMVDDDVKWRIGLRGEPLEMRSLLLLICP